MSKPFSRRTLFGSAGAALAGGVALSQPAIAAQTAHGSVPHSPTEWLPRKVERGGDSNAIAGAPSGAQHHLTSFIDNDTGLTAAKLNHQHGWAIQIKPTGYRGIPIYTIKQLELKVDGVAVDPKTITFVYENAPYRLEQLPTLLGMQWWVFDWATLFVPGEMPAGDHDIEVNMVYANTYFVGEASMTEKQRLTYRSNETAFLCL